MSQITDATLSSVSDSTVVYNGLHPVATGLQDHLLLAAIVNASDDAILSKTLDGTIISWNPAAERLFGYTAEEMIGKPKTILFPQDRLQEEQTILERLKHGIITDQFETVRLHRNGTPLYVSVTVSPIKAEDGRVIGASTIARDITERKMMSLQRAILDCADYSIISTDVKGIIQTFNRAAERMLGYSAEEVVGKVSPAPLHDAEEVAARAESLTQELGRTIAPGFEVFVAKTWEGVSDENEWTYIRKDGSRLPVRLSVTAMRDVGGTLTGYLGIAQDITVRKQAERKLQESEERFQAFINEGSQYAWITDAEGVVAYLNEPYCAIIGRTLEDCLGKTVFDIYPAEVAHDMLANIQQVVRTGKKLETIETAPLPDGKMHHFLVHKFLLGEVNGRALVGGSAVDITERSEAEQALQRNEERLREAQQIARIGSWERNLATGQISWSEELFHIYRFDPAEGMPDFERVRSRIHPEDWEQYQSLLAAATEQGQRYESHLRLLFEDGTITWGHAVANVECDATGQVLRRFGTLMDVTEQKQKELALRKSQEQLTLAQKVAQMGSWEYDLATGVIAWSPELFHLLDLNPEQGEPDYTANLALFHPEDVPMLDACVQLAVRAGKDYELDLRRTPRNGQPNRWYHAVGRVVFDDAGQAVQLAGTLTDITERKHLEAELHQNVALIQKQNRELESKSRELSAANAHLADLATTDGLTGAKNHRAFQEKLSEEFTRAERTCRSFSIILLDVDKFKPYNDTYGHPEGDCVLKQVVHVLQETAREMDFVARYGGEEFVILLPETGMQDALDAAERMRAAIEAQEWPLRPVTASFGVASLRTDMETAQQIVEIADKAMYASKQAGRNCCTHADAIKASCA